MRSRDENGSEADGSARFDRLTSRRAIPCIDDEIEPRAVRLALDAKVFEIVASRLRDDPIA